MQRGRLSVQGKNLQHHIAGDVLGLVRRLFGTDGLDETAEDVCELYRQSATGKRIDKTLKVKPDEAVLTEMIAQWFPTERARILALVKNPEELYGF